jgi:hypothetical protein
MRPKLSCKVTCWSGCAPRALVAQRKLQNEVLIPLELPLSMVTDLTPSRFADIGVHELRLAPA